MMQDILNAVCRWAAETDTVEAVVVVGSYARGAQTAASDLDLCILSSQKPQLVAETSFVDRFGTVLRQQTEDYGKCTSIRVWYADGSEVEFGLVDPDEWLERPLDSGTRQVLADGYRVLLDKKDYFLNLEL